MTGCRRHGRPVTRQTRIRTVSIRLDRNTIGHLLRAHGIDAWGVADNRDRGLPLSPDLPTAIVVMRGLSPAALRDLEHGPTAAYYEEYRLLNRELTGTVTELAATVCEHGHEAVAIAPTSNDAAAAEPLYSHKSAATRAGLGWIGKTGLFVSAELGPAVRLAGVFTDLELPGGRPVVSGRCGDCRRCVDACPAQAGRDVRWSAGMPRDQILDAAACERHMAQTSSRFNGSICGICIAVCPYTEAVLRRGREDASP